MGEGRNAGMWTIGITATGNEIGISQTEWEALSSDEKCQRERQAAARLTAAGAQFTVASLAACGGVLEQIERRLAAGEKP